MRKLFADDLELLGTLLPGLLFIPLILIFGAPAGLLTTAMLWLGFRSVGVIFASTPDSRFDPAEAAARTMARLSATVPEGRPSGLAEALATAAAERPAEPIELAEAS